MDEQNKRLLMRIATYASVTMASVLIGFKAYAWSITDSVSLLSTLIDSVLDVGASLVNLIAVHYALQPADHDHRFGHGKAEPLAGLIQSGFIAASALFLLIETGKRFFNPAPLENGELGITVMVISIFMTVCLVVFQKYVVAKTRSVAIQADSLHYSTDVLVNIGVIVALVLTAYSGWLWVDPFIAVIIAIYILWSVREIAVHAIDLLMDKEFGKEERLKIRDAVMENKKVMGVHDIRTRSSGPNQFIQLHLVLNGDMNLRESHEICEDVEKTLEALYPAAEVLVHLDPHDSMEAIPDYDGEAIER